MNNLNLFEVLQILAKNKDMKAVKANGCQIVWQDKVIDNSEHKVPNEKIRQLVFINLTNHVHVNILTDIMIEQQNYNMWSIVPT
jgi:hypothetical protein